MGFQALLEAFLSDIEGAQGAIVVAFDGEPVAQVVAKGSAVSVYDLQLLGAQMRVTLATLQRTHQRMQCDPPLGITLRLENRSFFVWPLIDDYFVLLAVSNGFGVVGAEHKVESIAQRLLSQM